MKKLTGEDHLELTSLHTVQLRMADPDALKYYLENYAEPLLSSLGEQKALNDYTISYANELSKITNDKNTLSIPSKKFEYRSIDVDNSKKSREQYLRDRLFDAEHARRILGKQEALYKARGVEVDRHFQNAEIRSVLGFINYLLSALDDVDTWPDKALFFQSYLAYRNVYRDYMNVNNKKW